MSIETGDSSRLVDDSSDLEGDEALSEGCSIALLSDFDRLRRRLSFCSLAGTFLRTDIKRRRGDELRTKSVIPVRDPIG